MEQINTWGTDYVNAARIDIDDFYGAMSLHERLRLARKNAGIGTAAEAARAIGIPEPTFTSHENGTREPSLAAVRRYSEFFRISLDWLVEGRGKSSSGAPEHKSVRVSGLVRRRGLIDFSFSPGDLGEVPAPAEFGDWNAVKVAGDAVYPWGRDGDILYYLADKHLDFGKFRKESVVALKSGPIYVRILAKGSASGLWHLLSVNDEPLLDCEIDWASPISWVRR